MARYRNRLTLSAGVVLLLAAGSVALQSAAASRSAQPSTTGPSTGIVAPPPLTLGVWTSENNNTIERTGTVVVNGSPVSGVRVRVDNYDVPKPTNSQGRFTYFVDHTLLLRHVVTVTDASGGKAGGQPLSSADKAALTAAEGSIDVAYAVSDLQVSRNGAGQPVITGRLAKTNKTPPPAVGLLTYQLKGTITDSGGKPVSGAQLSTRTLDRDYWTVSTESDSAGHYVSLFTASAEEPGNPVPFTVRVSKGDDIFQFRPQEFVEFQRLKSAELDIRLPPRGYAMALPQPRSYPGAVYAGTVVGVTSGTTPVRPVSATWPDRTGRFTITLPKSLAGKSVALWQGKLNLFSVAEAKPGGPIDVQSLPTTLPREVPRNLVDVKLK